MTRVPTHLWGRPAPFVTRSEADPPKAPPPTARLATSSYSCRASLAWRPQDRHRAMSQATGRTVVRQQVPLPLVREAHSRHCPRILRAPTGRVSTALRPPPLEPAPGGRAGHASLTHFHRSGGDTGYRSSSHGAAYICLKRRLSHPGGPRQYEKTHCASTIENNPASRVGSRSSSSRKS